MIVGGYSLDLYCDTNNPAHRKQANHGCDTAQFGGYTKAAAVRMAKRAGWTFNWRTHTAYCPVCKTYRPPKEKADERT